MSIARKVKREGGRKAKAKPGAEMVFIPGGEFTMGSDHALRRGEAGASRQGRRLLDRHDAGDECRVPALRQ